MSATLEPRFAHGQSYHCMIVWSWLSGSGLTPDRLLAATGFLDVGSSDPTRFRNPKGLGV